MNEMEAIIQFLNLPQEYDYMIVSPLQAKRELTSTYLRERIFQRKGSTCQFCGSKNNITIHHKTYELLLPKNLRLLGGPHAQKSRMEICKKLNNRIQKKYYVYANENHKWQLIEKRFPDFFEKTLNNFEVLCWDCHKKKHRDLERDTGSFMPLRKVHTPDSPENSSHTVLESGRPFKKIREKYPHAYKPWTEQLDTELNDLFSAGKTIGELATHFQRKPGGIRARLRKFGLIQ